MVKKSIINYLIVKDFLAKVGGEYAIELVNICEKAKKPVTDEQIGKKLPLKITEIRTILNRLHYRGIAFYKKTRNNKTGWYSYTWQISKGRIAEIILEDQKEEIEKLERKLDMETGYEFFACKDKCNTLQLEISAEYKFKCPECGDLMQSIDNKKAMGRLNKDIMQKKDEIKKKKKFLK